MATVQSNILLKRIISWVINLYIRSLFYHGDIISISIISNDISLVLYFRGFVHPYCLESSNKI